MTFKQTRRGIYLLPNLFTTASLFAAFYSIVASMNQQLEMAAMAIFIGMVADGLDGRVARLTNTETAFGAQYDSLSDMVTFGVAPALLSYRIALNQLGKVGWLIAFIYTAAVALRLARFNTQVANADKRYFQGLACPAAAAVLASFSWLSLQNGFNGFYLIVLMSFLTAVSAALMVSNVRYYSFKDIDSKGKVPFITLLLMVLIFVGIAAYPALVIFVGFTLYALSGPLHTLIKIQRMRRLRRIRKNK